MKNRNHRNLLSFALFAAGLFLLPGCEKVIDIDLKETTPNLVIEANIPLGEPCMVRLTKTVNFNAPNDFPPVSGAVVTLSDDTGASETLLERADEPGVYGAARDENGDLPSGAILGQVEHTYSISVEVEGQTYQASSSLPELVPLDSVSILKMPFFGGEDRILAVANFQDPPNGRHFAKINLFINHEKQPEIFALDNIHSMGLYLSIPMYTETEIAVGDTLTLDFQIIDEATCLYFYSLSEGQSGNSASPANPVTNFSGGCLGYFSAHTSEFKSVIVEENGRVRPLDEQPLVEGE